MVQIKLPALFLFAAITSVVAIPVPPRHGSITPPHNSSPSSSSLHLVEKLEPVRAPAAPVAPKTIEKKKSFIGRFIDKFKRPKTPPAQQSHTPSPSTSNEPKRRNTSPIGAHPHRNEPQRGNTAPEPARQQGKPDLKINTKLGGHQPSGRGPQENAVAGPSHWNQPLSPTKRSQVQQLHEILQGPHKSEKGKGRDFGSSQDSSKPIVNEKATVKRQERTKPVPSRRGTEPINKPEAEVPSRNPSTRPRSNSDANLPHIHRNPRSESPSPPPVRYGNYFVSNPDLGMAPQNVNPKPQLPPKRQETRPQGVGTSHGGGNPHQDGRDPSPSRDPRHGDGSGDNPQRRTERGRPLQPKYHVVNPSP